MRRYRQIVVSLALISACNTPPKMKADSTATKVLNDSTVALGGTKLQRFSAKTGAVIIKGFQETGTLRGQLQTTIIAEAREITDASDGSRTDGITLEVKSAGAYDKSSVSYIDFDEIESLIQGIDYIAKIDTTATRLASVQADYTTRGDLRVSSFSEQDRKMSLAVHSGSIGGTTAYLSLAQATDLKALIGKARDAVVRARPVKPHS
jgi:hypothetical protein